MLTSSPKGLPSTVFRKFRSILNVDGNDDQTARGVSVMYRLALWSLGIICAGLYGLLAHAPPPQGAV
jgi:hypothetical protein